MPPPGGTPILRESSDGRRATVPLDNRQERAIFLLSNVERRTDAASRRPSAGHAGPVGAAHAPDGSPARVGDRPADPAGLGGGPARRPGLALSVAAPAGARGLDRGG